MESCCYNRQIQYCCSQNSQKFEKMPQITNIFFAYIHTLRKKYNGTWKLVHANLTKTKRTVDTFIEAIDNDIEKW